MADKPIATQGYKSVVPDDPSACELFYGGGTTVTVSPGIPVEVDGNVTTVTLIASGTTISIPKTPSKFSFTVGTTVFATIWNHDGDDNKIEITGGKKIKNTEPFTVTVNLAE